MEKMEKESSKREVKVTLVYDLEHDTVNIDSGFFNSDFKDPIGYTAKLIEMSLEKWILEKIGMECPNCDIKIDPEWNFCPQCGWSWKKEEKSSMEENGSERKGGNNF
jgi:hypothetical protein